MLSHNRLSDSLLRADWIHRDSSAAHSQSLLRKIIYADCPAAFPPLRSNTQPSGRHTFNDMEHSASGRKHDCMPRHPRHLPYTQEQENPLKDVKQPSMVSRMTSADAPLPESLKTIPLSDLNIPNTLLQHLEAETIS